VEDKIISNLLQGFPFSFPFWRGPMDQVSTLEDAVAHEWIYFLPSMHRARKSIRVGQRRSTPFARFRTHTK